jgi:hypothetical protein
MLDCHAIKIEWKKLVFDCKVKPVYNDHPRDPKFLAVVVRWSLFRGSFMLWKLKLGPQNSGRCREVVVICRWSLYQVWMYLYLLIVAHDWLFIKLCIFFFFFNSLIFNQMSHWSFLFCSFRSRNLFFEANLIPSS